MTVGQLDLRNAADPMRDMNYFSNEEDSCPCRALWSSKRVSRVDSQMHDGQQVWVWTSVESDPGNAVGLRTAIGHKKALKFTGRYANPKPVVSFKKAGNAGFLDRIVNGRAEQSLAGVEKKQGLEFVTQVGRQRGGKRIVHAF